MTVKRNSNQHSHKGMSRSSQFASYTPYTIISLDNFMQATQSHPTWNSSDGGGDIGGSWLMERTTWEINPIIRNDLLCKGPTYGSALIGWTPGAQSTVPSNASLAGLGATAISRTAPNNPVASVSQSLGEAREGFPKMFGSGLLKEKSRFLKGSGNEYLNVQFGWLPIISDLKKYAHAVKDCNAIIAQYKKGSDQKIRRRYQFPPTKSSDSRVGRVVLSPANAGAIADGTRTETKETRSWFSGAFRYHLPIGDDLASKFDRYESYANKLLGVSLTPDTVWNLAPWSWAVDWFSNTGDVMTNISNLGKDGLAMQYGYMMQSSKEEAVTTFDLIGQHGYVRRVHEIKVRYPASPYGFSTTFDGLTNRQLAICAALGITRVR